MEFKEKTEEWEIGGEEREVNEEWGEIVKRIREEVRMKRKGIEAKNGWWNEECRKRKKEVGRLLKKWRKRKDSKRKYRRGRREYKELCEKR